MKCDKYMLDLMLFVVLFHRHSSSCRRTSPSWPPSTSPWVARAFARCDLGPTSPSIRLRRPLGALKKPRKSSKIIENAWKHRGFGHFGAGFGHDVHGGGDGSRESVLRAIQGLHGRHKRCLEGRGLVPHRRGGLLERVSEQFSPLKATVEAYS